MEFGPRQLNHGLHLKCNTFVSCLLSHWISAICTEPRNSESKLFKLFSKVPQNSCFLLPILHNWEYLPISSRLTTALVSQIIIPSVLFASCISEMQVNLSLWSAELRGLRPWWFSLWKGEIISLVIQLLPHSPNLSAVGKRSRSRWWKLSRDAFIRTWLATVLS